MSYRRLPIYTNTPKPYSPYHYDYQISKKNDENKVLGGYIDESIRSTMRTESHYTPLKLASSQITINTILNNELSVRDKETTIKILNIENIILLMTTKANEFKIDIHTIESHPMLLRTEETIN